MKIVLYINIFIIIKNVYLILNLNSLFNINLLKESSEISNNNLNNFNKLKSIEKIKKSFSNFNKSLFKNSINYFEDWISYIKYNEGKINDNIKNKQFLENKDFYNLKNENIKESVIPNNKLFFCVLTSDNILIYNTKYSNNIVNKQIVDSLYIDNIIDIYEDDITNKNGGINEIKKYEEGYCFKIRTKLNNNNNSKQNPIYENLIICLNDKIKSIFLLNKIAKLKIEKQRYNGVYNYVKNITNEKLDIIKNTLSKTDKLNKGWIIIKDWGECSVNCGGGYQTQQLLCLTDNKIEEDSCIGPATRTRSCNNISCEVKYAETSNFKNNTVSEKLDIIKKSSSIKNIENNILSNIFNYKIDDYTSILSVSSIHLKDIECEIKESFVVVIDPLKKVSTYMAKLLINKYTISVIDLIIKKNNNNNNVIDSFPLNITDMKILKQGFIEKTFNLNSLLLNIKFTDRCFILETTNNSKIYCDFLSDLSNNFTNTWMKVFNKFKFKCNDINNNNKLFKSTINYNNNPDYIIDNIQKEFEEKKNTLSSTISLNNSLKLINSKKSLLNDNNNNTNYKHENNEEDYSMKILQKEDRIESMIELEESVKEKDESSELEIKLEHEKKKEEIILKVFEDKAKENFKSLNIKTLKEEEEKDVKDLIDNQLQRKRLALKNKLIQMKKKANRKKIIFEENIQRIKKNISEKISNFYYINKDNVKKCFIRNSINTVDSNSIHNTNKNNNESYFALINRYCDNLKNDTKFISKIQYLSNKEYNKENDDIYNLILNEKINNCKINDNFCYFCCENEIGEYMSDIREECYKTCQNLDLIKIRSKTNDIVVK